MVNKSEQFAFHLICIAYMVQMINSIYIIGALVKYKQKFWQSLYMLTH